MWLYRCLLNVTWKEKSTNKSILEELNTKLILLKEMNRRKMEYVGHAVRNPKTDLKTSILQGRATAVIHGQYHSDQWTDPGPSHTPQQRSRRLA